MGDFLLSLNGRPLLRRLARGVGVPVPPPLRRGDGPYAARPLEGRRVALGGDGALQGPARAALEAAGAVLAPPGEDAGGVDVLALDASAFAGAGALRALHDFLHPRVKALPPSGRVLALGRPADAPDALRDPSLAAAREGLDGFVRSLAKEVGRRGSTVHLVEVDEGAEDRLGGPVTFLASDRAAFVSGQRWRIDAAAAGPRPAPGHRAQPLAGLRALVTGAARGIGQATARRLAEEGAWVLCLDLPDDAAAVSALSGELGGAWLAADLTGDDVTDRICAAAGGGLDVVVHNAGVLRDKTLGNMDAAAWDLSLAVNLGVAVRVTDALLARGAIRDGGRIVCLSSIAGIAGNAGQCNYATAKAGLRGFVRAQAAALAGRGVTVNAVAPGFVETRMTATIPVAMREAGRRLSALSQGGLPLDVAEAVTFLATPAAVGITGRTVRVCGGGFLGA